jgi:hypothetical protein
VAPLFVQHASNTVSVSSGTTTTLAATFTASATAGNALFAAITALGGSSLGTITSVTTNGTAENWASAVSAVENGGIGSTVTAAVWYDANTGGGQKIVDVNVSWATAPGSSTKAAILVDTYEFSGFGAAGTLLDKTSSGTSSGSNAWSSGATATTTQASELWIGVGAGGLSSTFTMGAPASPWTNETQLSSTYESTSIVKQQSGYQIASATAAATYNSTFSSISTAWAAAVATFKAGTLGSTGLPGAGGMLQPVTVIPYRAGWASAGHSR